MNWEHSAKDYEAEYYDFNLWFWKDCFETSDLSLTAAIHCKKGCWGINNEDTKTQIPIIKKIAKNLKFGDLIPGTIHPSTGGATLIAEAMTANLAAK